jgi:hypothetical protein
MLFYLEKLGCGATKVKHSHDIQRQAFGTDQSLAAGGQHFLANVISMSR